jgi:hypothetical protein
LVKNSSLFFFKATEEFLFDMSKKTQKTEKKIIEKTELRKKFKLT